VGLRLLPFDRRPSLWAQRGWVDTGGPVPEQRPPRAHFTSHSTTSSPAYARAMTLDPLRDQLRAFAAARDWQAYHSPKNLAMALSVEVGELLEHFQWLTEAQSQQLSTEQRTAVAHEMADVFIYLVQLSTSLGLDLMQAAQDKMVLNAAKYPAPEPTGVSAGPLSAGSLSAGPVTSGAVSSGAVTSGAVTSGKLSSGPPQSQ
jgi:dCTP diphosphatase